MNEDEQEEFRVQRPLPCPNCESRKGYANLGVFRSQCLNCNSTFPNSEVGRDNQDPQ